MAAHPVTRLSQQRTLLGFRSRCIDVPLNTAYSRLPRAKLALRAELAALSPEGQAMDVEQTAQATRNALLG